MSRSTISAIVSSHRQLSSREQGGCVHDPVTGIHIDLSSLQVEDCLSLDTNNDDRVTVDELVRVVNAALNGCL